MSEPPTFWQSGAARLLDFGRDGDPVILVVPSLVNRPDILDLSVDRSLMRFLAASSLRPLLLDWGWPGASERAFTLTQYIDGPLGQAMEAAAEAADMAGCGPPSVVGYCMGGTMAVAAAQRRPGAIGALALLATPWDFWTGRASPPDPTRVDGLLDAAGPVMAASGTLPVDWLQAIFALIDPGGVARKYRAFAALDPSSQQAERFVALEDWLNDGVPLAAPVARETLNGWYGQNTPARGLWRVDDTPVDPGELRIPTWVAIPERDRIVPPGSARALAGAIRGSVIHSPHAGHIGMVAGIGAEEGLWRPLRDWLLAAAGMQSARLSRPARRR